VNSQKQKFFIYACSISVIILWSFLWFQYRYDSNQAISSAETNVSNLSKAFEENILGTIRHLDNFLVTLRNDYPERQEQIPALIASYNRHSDRELIIQLSITDARGIMVYNTKEMPDKPLDLSDREHVRVHLNSGEDKLFISKPVLGRVSKKWSIQFTRKVLNRDGTFVGVAVLSVDPDYFTSFFKSIDVGNNGDITLLGMDGVIRARSSNPNSIGTTIPPTDVQIDTGKPMTGIYHSPGHGDPVPCIAAYRRLKHYPLVVRVATAEEEVYRVLHWHRNNMILQGSLASVGLLLIFWLAHRLTARQQMYTKELETINSSLQERITTAIAEIRQKDQVMISQSRQAAMGEMIGNIAHQWRQPLNALAMVLGNIRSAHQYDELTAEYLDKTVEKGNLLLQKMSTTITDFSNFFRPDKAATTFSAREQISHAVALVESGLENQNISVQLDAPQDVLLSGFPNEYSQVLLNLFANARDAIKQSGVAVGIVTIRLYERDGQGCVSVSDNGGGIPADVIDKVFEPYFSTKELGTGIGLYMSKMIIERSMNGSIVVHNIEGGAEFIIVTPMEGNCGE
jgi:signal transduction histidine kinase